MNPNYEVRSLTFHVTNILNTKYKKEESEIMGFLQFSVLLQLLKRDTLHGKDQGS
jgi:hypothetical protein